MRETQRSMGRPADNMPWWVQAQLGQHRSADSTPVTVHAPWPTLPPSSAVLPPVPTVSSLPAPQSTFLYASLLRQLGHQAVSDLLGLSPGSRPLDPASEAAAAALAAAVAQLRQAAGVYDYLAKQVLPAMFLTIKGDRWVGAGVLGLRGLGAMYVDSWWWCCTEALCCVGLDSVT